MQKQSIPQPFQAEVRRVINQRLSDVPENIIQKLIQILYQLRKNLQTPNITSQLADNGINNSECMQQLENIPKELNIFSKKFQLICQKWKVQTEEISDEFLQDALSKFCFSQRTIYSDKFIQNIEKKNSMRIQNPLQVIKISDQILSKNQQQKLSKQKLSEFLTTKIQNFKNLQKQKQSQFVQKFYDRHLLIHEIKELLLDLDFPQQSIDEVFNQMYCNKQQKQQSQEVFYQRVQKILFTTFPCWKTLKQAIKNNLSSDLYNLKGNATIQQLANIFGQVTKIKDVFDNFDNSKKQQLIMNIYNVESLNDLKSSNQSEALKQQSQKQFYQRLQKLLFTTFRCWKTIKQANKEVFCKDLYTLKGKATIIEIEKVFQSVKKINDIYDNFDNEKKQQLIMNIFNQNSLDFLKDRQQSQKSSGLKNKESPGLKHKQQSRSKNKVITDPQIELKKDTYSEKNKGIDLSNKKKGSQIKSDNASNSIKGKQSSKNLNQTMEFDDQVSIQGQQIQINSSKKKNSTIQNQNSSNGKQYEQKTDYTQQISDAIQELNEINCCLKKTESLQGSLTKLLLGLFKDVNEQQISSLVKKSQRLMQQYDIAQQLSLQLDQIKLSSIQKPLRIKKAKQIISNIVILNMIEINIGQKSIQSQVKKYNLKSAFILLGLTGSGKTTTMTGLSGHEFKVIKHHNVEDSFIAADPIVAKSNRISNSPISCTKWPSVEAVKTQWLSQKQKAIDSIDTAGLEDNRSQQIDIVNNLATEQLIKSLDKGRVVIVLSKFNVDMRLDTLKRMGQQMQKYFMELQEIQKSITFIFTMGLKSEYLLEKVKLIIQKDNRAPIFFGILEQRLQEMIQQQQNNRPWEIDDPSKHKFKQTVKYLQKTKALSNMGSYISASFSEKSNLKIKNKILQLSNFVNTSYEKGSSELTIFYLEQLKLIQMIRKNTHQTYTSQVNSLKQSSIRKSDQCIKLLSKFIDTNDRDYLKEFQKAKQNIKSINQLSKLLFINSETPLQKADNYLNYRLKDAIWLFSNCQSIQAEQSKTKSQLLAHLQLLKEYNNEEYENALRFQQNKKQQFMNKITNSLKPRQLKSENWKVAYDGYKNLFLINEANDQNQKIKKIADIALETINQQNIKKQITGFIENGRHQYFQIELKTIVSNFLDKLKILMESHYLIKQKVYSIYHQIINLLRKQSQFYKNSLSKLLDMKQEQITKIYIYTQNSDQIFELLTNYDESSQMIEYSKNQSLVETMKVIKLDLQSKTKQFKQIIISNSRLQQKLIDIIDLQNKFQTLCKLLSILKLLLKSSDGKSEDLKTTITQSERIIKQIFTNIQSNCDNQIIINYQVNYKLIGYFVTLKILKPQLQHQPIDQKLILPEICKKNIESLKTKLMLPLINMQEINFEKVSDFQNLECLLQYLKRMDKMLSDYSSNSLNGQSLEFFGKYISNQTLKKIILKSFQVVNNNYKINFKDFANVFDENMDQKNPSDNNLKFERSKVQQSIHYIRCFQIVKQISVNFKGLGMKEIDNQYAQLQQIDLTLKLKNKLQSFEILVYNKQQGKINSVEIVEIKKFMIVVLKIFDKTNNKNLIQLFAKFQEKIIQIGKSLSKDWEKSYELKMIHYKAKIQSSETFKQLQSLIEHEGSKIIANKSKLKKQLLKNIDQNIGQLLNQMYIKFQKYNMAQKIEFYINIYKFKALCLKVQYVKQFDQNKLIEQGKQLFEAFQSSYNQIIDKVKTGIQIQQLKSDISELKEHQDTIKIYSSQQYKNYIKSINNSETTLYQSFKKKLDQELKDLQNYSSNPNLKIDQKMYSLFRSSKGKIRFKLTENFKMIVSGQIQKMKTQRLKDHTKYLIQEQTVTKLLQKSPIELKKEVQIFFKSVIQQNKSNQKETKQKLQNSLLQRNPTDVLDKLFELNISNNKQMAKFTEQCFIKYIKQQKAQFCFDNLQNCQLQLSRNFGLLQDAKYITLYNQFSNIKQELEDYKIQIKSNIKTFCTSAEQKINKFNLNYMNSFNQQIQLYKRIQEIIAPQNNIIKIMKNIIYLSHKFELHLKEEFQISKKLGQNLIKNNNQSLSKNITFLKQILSKENGGSRNQNKQNKANKIYLDLIHGAIIKKQCSDFIELKTVSEIQEKIDQNLIIQYDLSIKQTKTKLTSLYNQAKQLSIKEIFGNGTDERIKTEIQNKQASLIAIHQVAQLFVKQSIIPSNSIKDLQHKYEKQYLQWEHNCIETIQRSFKCVSDEYEKMEKIDQFFIANKFIQKYQYQLFPKSMKVSNQISNIIVKNYKENTRLIQNFYFSYGYINPNLKYYKQKIDMINKIKTQKFSQLQKFTKLKNEQFEKFTKQNNKQLQEKLKNLPNNKQKQSKQADLKKQYSSDQQAKKNDFFLETQLKKEDLQKVSEKKINEINKDLIEFFQNKFINYVIINRICQAYYKCEQSIKSQSQKKKISSHFKQVVSTFGPTIIKILNECLQINENNYSKLLRQQQPIFSSLKVVDYINKTKGKDIQFLLDNIKIDETKKKRLSNRYQQYNGKYEQILEKYQCSVNLLLAEKEIINKCSSLGQQISQTYKQDSKKIKVQRYQLMAYIFALWTIKKSDTDQNNAVRYLYKPHAGQVLAVFLLLEFDQLNMSQKIKNAMIQVSTGQGKSVILGAVSCYLALVGFTVYEACYSKYLSQRDYELFKDVFSTLRIQDKIHYNIFPEICKMMLDQNPDQTFVSKVYKLLVDQSYIERAKNAIWRPLLETKAKSEHSILLIDQADVFVNQEFLGQYYCPAVKIQRNCIRDLLDFLWKKKDQVSKLKPQDIIASPQFKKVCKKLNHDIFTKIMENQVHSMLRGLANFNKDQSNRTVLKNKIYYRQGDGLTNKVHYGYKTIFAYYYEYHVTKNIDQCQLLKQLNINLIVASFSYSKLPKYFDSILGVTGTLQSMSNAQIDILETDYEVEKRMVLPSIYPPSNRKVKFVKAYNLQLYKTIIKSIQQEHDKNRPIIIFFKNKSEVYNFYDSQQFKHLKTYSSIVTYEVDQKTRDFRIQTSTFDGKITLMTFDFGRGTDFKILSNKQNHPGLHIISSYVPDSYCDYIQLIGRVGRQGKNGTALIIMEQDCEVKQNESQVDQQQAQQLIKMKDNRQWDVKLQKIRNKMEVANKIHEHSAQIYSYSLGIGRMLEKIYQLNKTPPITSDTSKTQILIDGTCSMSSTFKMVADVLKQSIPRVYKVLEKAKLFANAQMQLCVYRNYNSPVDQILQHTDFQLSSEPLIQWISKIQVNGGWGNQALQIPLHYVNNNKLDKIDQIILISDAAGNTKQDTDEKRGQYKHTWDKSPYPKKTYCDDQVAEIISKKIKIHTFYLSPSRTRTFSENISKKTGGDSKQFLINNNDAIDLFTNFVAQKILANLGEKTGSLNLVDCYKKMYC